MNGLKISLAAILATFALSSYSAENTARLEELSKLLREGATEGVTLEENRREHLEQLLLNVLPDHNDIGDDKEWKVVYHDMDEGDFFQVDLKKKGDTSFDRFVWFHILYKNETPEFYGSEDFGPYRGMGAEDVHYFILVGNIEIRAIADSDEYKSDEKIKGLLRAFKLKQIEQL